MTVDMMYRSHASPECIMVGLVADAVVAVASACGGTRVGAAMADNRLLVYEARLRDTALEYALIADVSLPSAPTDVAALPLPAPAFAVGCVGRWESCGYCQHFHFSSTFFKKIPFFPSSILGVVSAITPLLCPSCMPRLPAFSRTSLVEAKMSCLRSATGRFQIQALKSHVFVT